MKNLNLTFSDEDYAKLKKIYDHMKKYNKKIKSWEKFFMERYKDRSITE